MLQRNNDYTIFPHWHWEEKMPTGESYDELVGHKKKKKENREGAYFITHCQRENRRHECLLQHFAHTNIVLSAFSASVGVFIFKHKPKCSFV